ncbi:hypothetical protein FB567DRAFT_233179 [Paraphoma chrysanthemicola]|uniref:Uncharacterized protein n=1 Tax=Paraphoma chrysanthemicola TaxID=798071 RepID=A0A8K0W1U3_9PLEO|nr:hypothetical protein FB567DRAFT_233179 [Paraphoma chrysanthemicola]
MSQLQAEYVKRGFWTNHEVGPILGKTITTDVRTGNLVVALLAVLTTFGLGHLWNIVMFAYHQMRTLDHDSDGHFHQQQALLRTLPPPNAVATTWIKLWWTWRGRADRAFARTWAFAVASIVFTLATVVVGVFASYLVSNSGIQVLVDSPLCAPFDMDRYWNMTKARKSFDDFNDYTLSLTAASHSYSRDCYQNVSILAGRCSSFVRPNIRFAISREDCPFSGLCADISQPGVSMDSGLINVNDAFGLNLQPRDSIRFRRKNTCAFLKMEGRYDFDVTRYDDPNKQFRWERTLRLYFGSSFGDNDTFQISMISSKNNYEYVTLQLQYRPYFTSLNPFEPLSEMRTTDADLTIGTLSKNMVRYWHPVNDPFFAAHKPYLTYEALPSNLSFYNYTLYESDFPVSVFACKEQFQYCFMAPNSTEICGSLQGVTLNASTSDYTGATAVQIAAIQLLQFSTYFSNSLAAISTGALAGDEMSRRGIKDSLPDDQWYREIIAWEGQVWSGMQIVIADYATGFANRNPNAAKYTDHNSPSGGRQLCASVRMRMPGGFVNINVFALAFVTALTCAFIITDIILLRILIFTRRFHAAFTPRIERWIQDGVFHQQRRGYEAQELAAWTRTDKEIPVTVKKVKLPRLQAQLNYAMSNVANTPVSGQSTGVAAGNSTAGSGTVLGYNTSSHTPATPAGQTASTQAPTTGTTRVAPQAPTTSPSTTSSSMAPPTTPIPPHNTQPISQSPAQPVTQAQSLPNTLPAAQPLAQSSTPTTPTLPTAAPAASSSSRAPNASTP